MLGASDGEHLARARAEERVLFTQDVDFLRLHAAGIEHAGIVYGPPGMTISEIIGGLMVIVQVLEPKDIARHIEFL